MPPLPADFSHTRVCKPFCEKSLTLPFSVDPELVISIEPQMVFFIRTLTMGAPPSDQSGPVAALLPIFRYG